MFTSWTPTTVKTKQIVVLVYYSFYPTLLFCLYRLWTSWNSSLIKPSFGHTCRYNTLCYYLHLNRNRNSSILDLNLATYLYWCTNSLNVRLRHKRLLEVWHQLHQKLFPKVLNAVLLWILHQNVLCCNLNASTLWKMKHVETDHQRLCC